MPEGIEYLHFVQAALDARGLRYQVLDTAGRVRERLTWPLLPPSEQWDALPAGEIAALVTGRHDDRIVAFRFSGQTAPKEISAAQTLMSAFQPRGAGSLDCSARQGALPTVIMGPEQNRKFCIFDWARACPDGV